MASALKRSPTFLVILLIPRTHSATLPSCRLHSIQGVLVSELRGAVLPVPLLSEPVAL